MRIVTNYLNKHLQCYINFEEFYLLSILPRKDKTLVFLAPIVHKPGYSYFLLRIGTGSQYYPTLDTMLDAAISAKHITSRKASAIRRYYKRLTKKSKI